MAQQQITFKGKPVTITGRTLRIGDALPKFKVTANDMSDLTEERLQGKVAIISVVPSLDTPVCSLETKHFNHAAENISADVIVLTVSMDLPFAQKRWCAAEGAERVITASDYKYRSFGETFGTYIQELGLLTRAVFVVDRQGKITYVEYVPEIAAEPNYEAALNAAKALS